MVSQDNVNLKAINCNEDNSNRSNNDDQSNHGNYNSSGQKQHNSNQKTQEGKHPGRMPTSTGIDCQIAQLLR
jgi:hypothetical protein